jgi:putative transposase
MLNFKGMLFTIDVILVCIRWYAAYPLSYWNLEEMTEERRVGPPFIDQPVGGSFPAARREDGAEAEVPGRGGDWRMDETYVKVKGVWKYLYRAVDKQGKTVDFLLTAQRDMAATKLFAVFR